MEFKHFLDELKNLQDNSTSNYDAIKSAGLPVILVGAGEMAKWVTEDLKAHDIQVAGYAVDAKYFKAGQIFLGLPIYNVEEISKQADKYTFMLGMEDEMQGGSRAFEILTNKKFHCYPLPINLNGSSEKIDFEYVLQNCDKFKETFELLADELSRKTFINYLKLKVTGDRSYIDEIYFPSPYFNELTADVKNRVFVDCGAYNGDTIEKFISWNGGKYEKIFAIEPNDTNFAQLEKFVQNKNYSNVVLFNCGVGDKKGTFTFTAEIERTRFSEFGEIKLNVETLDDILANESVSFIKMEIQGSELNALQGATEILKNQKPYLAVVMFHKADALITIPQFINSVQKGYNLYLRKQTRIRDNGLLLYAIPKKKF